LVVAGLLWSIPEIAAGYWSRASAFLTPTYLNLLLGLKDLLLAIFVSGCLLLRGGIGCVTDQTGKLIPKD